MIAYLSSFNISLSTWNSYLKLYSTQNAQTENKINYKLISHIMPINLDHFKDLSFDLSTLWCCETFYSVLLTENGHLAKTPRYKHLNTYKQNLGHQ